jgi:hypothetical protein
MVSKAFCFLAAGASCFRPLLARGGLGEDVGLDVSEAF